MDSMSDIKHRIRSISQTQQITRAMHLISVSKMRKALAKHESNAAYFTRVRSAMKDILMHTGEFSHPFLKHEIQKSEQDRDAYIVIAGDKGMAGAYNHNVLKMALDHMQGNPREKYIFTVGQVAREFFHREGYQVDVEFLHTAQNPSLRNARQIAETLIDLYRKDLIDEIFVVYTEMVSTMEQVPHVVRLLPLLVSDFQDVQADWQDAGHGETEIKYEPSPAQVFDTLVPEYVIGTMYAMLVQSFASEHSARMNAMSAANRNADEMIKKLNLVYNRVRQASITQEIAEISGGAEALKDS